MWIKQRIRKDQLKAWQCPICSTYGHADAKTAIKHFKVLALMSVKKHKIIKMNYKHTLDDNIVKKLARWRKQNEYWFPSIFKVTKEGTRKWMQGIVKKKDRVLYLIYFKGKILGHMGFDHIDKQKRICSLDCVMRGERPKGSKGKMTLVLEDLIKIAFTKWKMKEINLVTTDDNFRAMALYYRCDFNEEKKVPLILKDNKWIEVKHKIHPERYNLYMFLNKR